MVNNLYIWLERLATLRRSLLRKVAISFGLQLVHMEILEYLSVCNRYSNTPISVTNYLGQTKGTVSQSLKWLENKQLIARSPDPNDKRSIRLSLTKQGQDIVDKLRKMMPADFEDSNGAESLLREVLHAWQKQTGLKGFGLCQTCRFNETLEGRRFRCGLTHETLSFDETQKICAEHDFAIDHP